MSCWVYGVLMVQWIYYDDLKVCIVSGEVNNNSMVGTKDISRSDDSCIMFVFFSHQRSLYTCNSYSLFS